MEKSHELHEASNTFLRRTTMMQRTRFLQIGGAIGLMLATIYSVAIADESILPSAMLSLMLVLVASIAPHAQTDGVRGLAAWRAIVSFSVFVAGFSLIMSYFFAGFAEYAGITGMFDGDLVRVSINDAHELAYSTLLLLSLYALHAGWLRIRQRPTA